VKMLLLRLEKPNQSLPKDHGPEWYIVSLSQIVPHSLGNTFSLWCLCLPNSVSFQKDPGLPVRDIAKER
jgi:hypothetical protein